MEIQNRAEIWLCKITVACSQKVGKERKLINKRCEELVLFLNGAPVMIDRLKKDLHQLWYSGKKNMSYIDGIEVKEKLKNLGFTNYDVTQESDFNFKYESIHKPKPKQNEQA